VKKSCVTAGVPDGGLRFARLWYLCAIAVPFVVLISAELVLPGWIPTLDRPLRRALTEALLQAVLVGYCAIFVAGLVGPLLLGGLFARSHRRNRFHRGLKRGFVFGLSCLVSLLMLELGSAAWRSWTHRMPSLPTRFVDAPPGEFRIVVLGGSSAAGEPYWPWLSVGQIVAWQLQKSVSDRRFASEILAYPGDSLEMQHQKLAGLMKRPDAVIIYSGHNEFAARFEEEREGWRDERSAFWLRRLAYRVSLSSPFYALAYELISKNRLDRPPSLSLRHELIDPPVASPVESAAILDDFGRRLEAIVAYCDRIGALPILIVPPANEAGYEPSRSTLPAEVTKARRIRLVEQMQQARAVETTDPAFSTRIYRTILEDHQGFAEAHFRLARLLEAQGQMTDAARHYLAALDHDGLPIRCQAPFRAVYRAVTARHPRCLLIDGRRELSEISPNGLLGDHVIHDTHHPTLQGHVALAGAVLRELARVNAFCWKVPIDLPLDPAACAVHFGMTAERWATTCDRISEHYRRVAIYRYDPEERLRKARVFADAGRRIRQGCSLDQLGLPGIGCNRSPKEPSLPRLPGESPRGPAEPSKHAPNKRQETEADGSFDDLFHLPVLQVDHRAAAQEMDHGDKLIAFGSANHLADHTCERSSQNPNRCADWHGLFRADRQARAQHRMDLAEIAFERFLVHDLDHADQAVGSERYESIVDIAVQEHVTGEQRDDRLNLPPLGCATFLAHLRQIVDDSLNSQVARDCFFLTGFRVQTPPDRFFLGAYRSGILPKIGWVAVGLGWQDRH
jgi:hypothetical protein